MTVLAAAILVILVIDTILTIWCFARYRETVREVKAVHEMVDVMSANDKLPVEDEKTVSDAQAVLQSASPEDMAAAQAILAQMFATKNEE